MTLKSSYKPPGEKGFTLVELMIALAIAVWAIGGVMTVYIGQQKNMINQDQIVTIQQNLRAAGQVMTSDIRMAGVGVAANEAISINVGGQITLNPTGNSIQYSLNANNDLIRDAGTPQVLAQNIQAVRFAYAFDIDGTPGLDTYTDTSNITRVIWAIDRNNNDNLLDTVLDADGDGDINLNDTNVNGSCPNNNCFSTGNPTGLAIPVEDIQAVRIWMLARTNRPDDNFLNTNTYAVGDQIITPNTDGDVTTDNVYMRLYDTVVTGKNMGL